ncbi:hypothetical protein [Sphingomonas sp. Root1294]|uniref:hypothetical protein n=1 Tax=Sphingomonas sp. Root1294 TaxID=1736447 RepID=UPI0012E33011|nr:hypothetical protein [Sphingomonas sp. Root1294]
MEIHLQAPETKKAAMRTLEIQRLHGGLAIIVNRRSAGAMCPRHPTLDAVDDVRSDDLARSKARMARIAPPLKWLFCTAA